jgi:hypothetical protein
MNATISVLMKFHPDVFTLAFRYHLFLFQNRNYYYYYYYCYYYYCLIVIRICNFKRSLPPSCKVMYPAFLLRLLLLRLYRGDGDDKEIAAIWCCRNGLSLFQSGHWMLQRAHTLTDRFQSTTHIDCLQLLDTSEEIACIKLCPFH